jgi:hypothetical protein
MTLPTGHVVDTQSSTTQSDLVEKFLDVSHPFSGPHVPSHVMTVANRASHYADAVGPLLKSLQDIFNVYFACARQFDHFGPGWVSKTESPGRVGSHISAVDASEDSNVRIETIIKHQLKSPKSSFQIAKQNCCATGDQVASHWPNTA